MNQTYINYYEIGISETNYMLMLIGLIGVISNLLSICVFSRKQLKQHSYSFYWRTKAIFDILLLTSLFRIWIKYSLNIDLNVTSPLFCRFSDYLIYVFACTSSLIESLITIDRFFIIVWSNKHQLKKQMKKRSVQIGLILALIVYSMCTNISIPLSNRLIQDPTYCLIKLEGMKIVWILALIGTIIVNLIMNPILDILIISHIISNRTLNRSSSTIQDRKFAISAISLNMTSLVLKLTYFSANLASLFLSLPPEKTSTIFSISLYVMLIDRIDIFFVNVLVNSVFRQEFLSLIGCYKSSNTTIATRTVSISNNPSAITINVTSLLFKLPFIFGNFLDTYFNLTPEQVESFFRFLLLHRCLI